MLFQFLYFSYYCDFSVLVQVSVKYSQSIVKRILHSQKCSVGLVSLLNTHSTWASKSCANGSNDGKADVEFQNAIYFSSTYFPVIN